MGIQIYRTNLETGKRTLYETYDNISWKSGQDFLDFAAADEAKENEPWLEIRSVNFMEDGKSRHERYLVKDGKDIMKFDLRADD